MSASSELLRYSGNPGMPYTYKVLNDCVDVDLLTTCQVIPLKPFPGATFTR